jgi:hypothetical protein
MDLVQGTSRGIPAPASSRRGMTSKMVRLAGGLALTVGLLATSGLTPVAAQDDTIVLTAGGSTLTVSPGYADAVSAVAEAHAGPGYAETIGAAARAVADCVDGAMTEGAAALAVAHPDEGALTEAGTVTSMTPEEMAAEIIAKNDAVQMIADSNRDDDSPIRKDIENRCDKEERKIEPPVYEEEEPEYVPEEEVIVYETPDTGSGTMALTALSSVFGAAAAAFAAGAVAVRNRNGASFAAITLNSDRWS